MRHVVEVEPPEEPGGDPVATILHPEACPFRVEVHGGNAHYFYECAVSHEADNVGVLTILGDEQLGERIALGLYSVDVRYEKTPSNASAFSEITAEYEVERLEFS